MSFDTQQQNIDRRKAIAQALRDSGNFSSGDVTRTASGGLVVPISPFAAVAKLLNTGLGAYGQYNAAQDQDELDQQKDAAQKAQVSGLMDALAGPSQMAVPKDTSAPRSGRQPISTADR
jgi:hypothetical protein